MRREYGGAVPRAALAVALGGTTGDLTIICDDLSGWPLVTNPIFIIVNRTKATEEKMLVSARTGNILTVSQRAADGTSISAHDIGEPIEHVFTATDADEANEHVNTTTGAHGYPPIVDVVTLEGTQTLTNKTMDGDLNTFTDIPQAAVTSLIPDLASKAVYPDQTGHANEILGTNGSAVAWVPRPTDGVDGAGIFYQPTAPVAPLNGDVWVDSDNIVATPAYIPPGGTAAEVLAKVDGTDYNVDWVPQSGGATTLDGLTDVTITTPADGAVLTYDTGSSQWIDAVPATPSSTLASLTDVTVGTPADNDSLTWDSGTSKWVPQAITGGAATPDDSSLVIAQQVFG
jgi:hypothetical protein